MCDDTVGPVVAIPIWRQPDKVVRLAVVGIDAPFDHVVARESLRNFSRESFQVEPARQVGDGASAVAGQDIEYPGDRWSETADDQLAVQENSADIRAFEQVLKIGIGAVEFIDLVVQL